MNKAVKSTLAITASAVAMASVAVTPSLVSAWGDNGGGRPSYTIDQINHGVLGNKIVFNSISDSVIGDEKNFVGARENTGINAGPKNVWNGNDITVEDGKEYLVRIYAHNNNPNGTNAISRNTRVAFNIPTYSAKQIKVNGFITSDNAAISEYWDYVNFNSDRAFHLEYVYGSALLENNGIGANGGVKLGDEIVTKAGSENGVQIGYDKLDGNVPGCYTYDNFVTIRVKAVFDYQYTITQTMRHDGAGSDAWSYNVNAKTGDIIEIQGLYKNTSDTQQNSVMIKSILPENFEYIPGTTVVYNANHPQGLLIDQDTIVTTGINIGHYLPNANAFIRFKVKVVDRSQQPGSNTLVNWLQAGVGQKTIQDYATVMTYKDGSKPAPAKQYNVRVNYIYAETGNAAAEPYVGVYESGDSFFVNSPEIDGYTPDHSVIRATVENSDLTFTVKYTKNTNQNPEDPKDDPRPEQPSAEVPVTNLPKTGPEAVAGSIVALGSLVTSGGYYIASRRALRK